MANYSENFYHGTDYGLDPDYGKEFSTSVSSFYRFPASTFGFPSDPTSANQLQKVSDKLSTGAKTIEVSGVNIMGGGGPGGLVEKIPRQHFKEINRLKKLTGVDLTFHGPLIEPTGVGQGNWSPEQRAQAERQMWNAVERAHELEPKGNVVVTFHSSNGLPEPRQRVKTKDGKEVSVSLSVIDERSGRYGSLPRPTKEHLEGEEIEADVDKELARLNEQNWSTDLNNINIGVSRVRSAISRFGDLKELGKEDSKLKDLDIDRLNKLSNNPQEWESFLGNLQPGARRVAEKIVDDLSEANIFAKDSYLGFKDLFNRAYEVVDREGNESDKMKLNKFKEEIAPVVKAYKEDPSNSAKLADAVAKGIRVLENIKPPQTFRPLEEFAIDKASETFANLAVDSYKKFKSSAPIISVENPPTGMGLTRADELRELIVASRKKFVDKMVKEGFSKSEAAKQAEKLIGATWDVGHINMIRKYGYKDKDIVAETKKIAPFVKHIHLSDNFGFEHTELPMGMGNVPLKEHLKAIKGYNKEMEKIKQIVETGDWFSRQGGLGLTNTPIRETLRAFGSPVSPMRAPYWNQMANTYGDYFTGFGRTLPEQHFAQFYGGGFTNLPAELGGQAGGGSRLGGGTPNE